MSKNIFFMAMLLCGDLSAQPLINISNFSNSIMYYNPAYAGAQNGIHASLIHKAQWTNVAGGPRLSAFSVNLPFNYERLGAGITIFRTVAGPESDLNVNANFSYKINFAKGRLAFGIRLGVVQVKEDINLLKVKDPDDVYIGYNKMFPEVGGGAFYKSKKYFVSFSFVRSAALYKGPDLTLKSYYYLMAGVRKNISESVFLLPSFMLQGTKKIPVQLSIALPLEYKKIFWVGVMYRSPAVVSVLGGVYLNELMGNSKNDVQLCYAFDRPVGMLYSGLLHSHELILFYNFNKSQSVESIMKRRVTVSPLYFD